VKVPTAIRTTYHHDDEIVLLEDLLVAHRWLEQMPVVVNPLLEVEWRRDLTHAGLPRRLHLVDALQFDVALQDVAMLVQPDSRNRLATHARQKQQLSDPACDIGMNG